MTLPLNSTINTIAVIGAGTMGIGIAQVAATAGLSVLLFDVNQDVLSRSLSTMTQRLRKRVAQGKPNPRPQRRLSQTLRWQKASRHCRTHNW